jgi:glycosyltransferase involved in cell wall biosynthesis
MNPLVSIVFTSYNHKKYLKQSLDSIITQTYKNVELIIVDDCSTDGSQEILKEYAHFEHVQLNLLEKNTGGYVKASNYGAKMAKGELLLFAQCDDFCEPRQIELLVQALLEHPDAGVAYSRSYLVDKDGVVFADDFKGREKAFREKCSRDVLISGREMRSFLSYSCVIPNLSAAMIRRSLYVESGGLSDKYLVAADWAFWLELSEVTNFYYLTQPLNYFRQHSTTIRSSIKATIQISEIYNIFYGHIRQFSLKGSDKSEMRLGAASSWSWYFLDSPKAWVSSFPAAFKTTFKLEKLNLVYLFCGFVRHTKEYVVRKMQRTAA